MTPPTRTWTSCSASVLANPRIAPRDRVRLACTVGAVMGALVLTGDVFSDVSSEELGALVKDAARDLLIPGG